ncbi:hypothetical protein CEXT_41291 [Caerostris extrusa]|uniref:Uncharacterized protein n=1 Tax=Caerostris extrusa TaxID=172846 RepID=A0AAV4TYR4_CAEEX|nr:hypothetical protein CEXT_41291 [Caerostris extrusa]
MQTLTQFLKTHDMPLYKTAVIREKYRIVETKNDGPKNDGLRWDCCVNEEVSRRIWTEIDICMNIATKHRAYQRTKSVKVANEIHNCIHI